MRTVIAIVTILAVLALLGSSFGPHVHLHGIEPFMGHSIVEGFLGLGIALLVIGVTIGAMIFTVIAVGSTLIGVTGLVLVILAAALLPALFPLFLLGGCIYLIVKAFDSATA